MEMEASPQVVYTTFVALHYTTTNHIENPYKTPDAKYR